MSNPISAGASRWAHFLGRGAHAEADPVDDKDKDGKKGGKKAATDDQGEDGTGAKAEGDDNDGGHDCAKCDGTGEDADGNDCKACDGTGDAPEDKKDAKADDDDSEMRGSSAAANARRRERARCSAIFASPQAAANPGLACSLAFETNMTRKEALRVLSTQPTTAARANRAGGNPRLTPSDGAADRSARTPAAGWAAAFAKNGVKISDRALKRT